MIKNTVLLRKMKEKLILNNLHIKHKVISVKHLLELQADIDKTEQEGDLANLKASRSYLNDYRFHIPEDFPEAKYIVVLAIEHNLAKVNFQFNGQKYKILLPHDYHKLDASVEELGELVRSEIIKDPSFRVEHNRTMFLKLLAVRSGLGKYGRNNICYVDSLGSFLSLYSFFTDYDFQVDNWHELTMMDDCEDCSMCSDNCPTQAIPEIDDDEFIIDVERCIPFHNEILGEFPDWMPKEAHNSLLGCVRCQQICPVNSKIIEKFIRLEDITEEETKMILEGKDIDSLTRSIGQKLRMYDSSVEFKIQIIRRNLEVLLN
ncbi:MAG: epoxyqueuosine reductase [Candidatus Heimdallarchaeota archaeon]|nr:epoxyqueuosine reductase [Candidatus Heimdallarchaeota archaeon]